MEEAGEEAEQEAMSILDPTMILARARVEAARLSQVPSWTPAFSESSPDAPLLVRRLDYPDQYFYIVSFHAAGRVTARLRINAETGAYSEGIGIGKSGEELTPWVPRDTAFNRMSAKVAADAKKQKKKKGLQPPIAMEPFYGWKPCAQSFSAMLPFYIFTVGNGTRYARVDGKIYDALTFGAGL